MAQLKRETLVLPCPGYEAGADAGSGELIQDFETLLCLPDVGPATIRSLSLLAEIIFQAPPSHRDPTKRRIVAAEGGTEKPGEGADPRRWADYSHAHGGKDGTPFPVDRDTYDRNIAILTDAIRRARLGENDKFDAFRRLSKLGNTADRLQRR